jgi:hypothetical protein
MDTDKSKLSAKEILEILENQYQIYHVRLDENCIFNLLMFNDILKLVKDKKLNKETFIWKPDMKEWKKAESFPELDNLFKEPPPFIQHDYILPN